MHLGMISQQELRGCPVSLVISYAVYKPHCCYLGEAHLGPTANPNAEGANANSKTALSA